MLCTSASRIVNLTMAGPVARFASHTRELLPAICTRGRRCSDTSCILGQWFDRVRTMKLRVWARAVVGADVR